MGFWKSIRRLSIRTEIAAIKIEGNLSEDQDIRLAAGGGMGLSRLGPDVPGPNQYMMQAAEIDHDATQNNVDDLYGKLNALSDDKAGD